MIFRGFSSSALWRLGNGARVAHLIAVVVAVTVSGAGYAQPIIGLVYGRPHYEQLVEQGRDRLESYRDAVEEWGAVIEVIGLGMGDDVIAEALERLNGLLLPGGIDVEPERYGEEPHPKLEKTDGELDALEFRALEFAREHRLPVLGICRGHQVLNVFYGGSLIQDIPAQHKSETPIAHRNGTRMHFIDITEGSLLRALVGEARLEVNTHHHQAVKRLAPGFRATAHSDDGIVEAIEHEGDVFVVGVQFHPERILDETPQLRTLFKRFVEEARQTMAAPATEP